MVGASNATVLIYMHRNSIREGAGLALMCREERLWAVAKEEVELLLATVVQV